MNKFFFISHTFDKPFYSKRQLNFYNLTIEKNYLSNKKGVNLNQNCDNSQMNLILRELANFYCNIKKIPPLNSLTKGHLFERNWMAAANIIFHDELRKEEIFLESVKWLHIKKHKN